MKGGDRMTDFEGVFEENREGIFRYLLGMTKNIGAAEELCQETFFRAYMNFSSLRKRESASAWLCQIAKNTYFAWYNEQKKILPIEQEVTDKSETDIEQELIRRETAQRVLRCLHELEEPYKEVFMLKVLGEQSLKDISTLFGKSESWARVTYHRARQKISERMKRDEEL